MSRILLPFWNGSVALTWKGQIQGVLKRQFFKLGAVRAKLQFDDIYEKSNIDDYILRLPKFIRTINVLRNNFGRLF